MASIQEHLINGTHVCYISESFVVTYDGDTYTLISQSSEPIPPSPQEVSKIEKELLITTTGEWSRMPDGRWRTQVEIGDNSMIIK